MKPCFGKFKYSSKNKYIFIGNTFLRGEGGIFKEKLILDFFNRGKNANLSNATIAQYYCGQQSTQTSAYKWLNKSTPVLPHSVGYD
jgi:hypothetical protein